MGVCGNERKEEKCSKWLGCVGRNERVINVCRIWMINFKPHLEQEKNN